MARQEWHPHETTAPRFDAARRWRAWHEWPGLLGIATGLALWIFVALGVVAPLADAVARFEAGSRTVPPGTASPAEEAGAGIAPGLCVCPDWQPGEALPARRG
ncbi:hypothetical protein [Anaeromyxobacter terrae]|uniref:hypothetical protein n=1 Tax=Anaeromyxobacter terrae TaxID=2925406 RepID=UPI001F563EB3|nr:hypothetical protein [Anaeromyxobacter sp. SG22]